MPRTPPRLYNAIKAFDDLRVRLPHETPQCKAWVDAYKGAGAFHTMQNLIRFHGCLAIDDKGMQLDKDRSLVFLSLQADRYKNGGAGACWPCSRRCSTTTAST